MGNIYSALLSWLSARSSGSEWVLRIEDIDRERSRREYADQIMDDLQWLGLTWDGDAVWQSDRSHIYHQHLERLNDLALVYPCHCTRAEIMATQAPHESDGRVVYAGTCRPAENAPLESVDVKEKLRLIVPDRMIEFSDRHYGYQKVNLASHCGDFVLRRADHAWAYQLAVVVDDATMGIEEVVRGRDLLLSTAQQIYLFSLLGYPVPTFTHLPLLCNTDGQRLSKRDKSLDLGELRSNFTAPEIVGKLAFHAGVIDRPEPVEPKDLIGCFDWNDVPREDIMIASHTK